MTAGASLIQEMDSFRDDMKWFASNISKLRVKYLNSYVLIKNQNVVLADKNYEQLLEQAQKRNIDLSTSVIEKVIEQDVMILL